MNRPTAARTAVTSPAPPAKARPQALATPPASPGSTEELVFPDAEEEAAPHAPPPPLPAAAHALPPAATLLEAPCAHTRAAHAFMQVRGPASKLATNPGAAAQCDAEEATPMLPSGMSFSAMLVARPVVCGLLAWLALSACIASESALLSEVKQELQDAGDDDLGVCAVTLRSMAEDTPGLASQEHEIWNLLSKTPDELAGEAAAAAAAAEAAEAAAMEEILGEFEAEAVGGAAAAAEQEEQAAVAEAVWQEQGAKEDDTSDEDQDSGEQRAAVWDEVRRQLFVGTSTCLPWFARLLD